MKRPVMMLAGAAHPIEITEPMSPSAGSRVPLTEEAQRQFSGLILLDRVVTLDHAYHAGLLETEDDTLLESVFDYLTREGLVDIGADDHYRATGLGRRVYQKMLHQQQSYLAHFDVFARVDLAEGVFGDPDRDHPDDPRWADLRVAVAEFKGIESNRMVFLAMLAGGDFFQNPDWKFDLALGSAFFQELEAVVRDQISLSDLAYEAEDGEQVSGESVIEDIILQGAKHNKRAMDDQVSRQQELFEPYEDEEDEDEGEEGENAAAGPNGSGDGGNDQPPAFEPYDPEAGMSAYISSATFVEPLWLEPYW